MAKKSKGLPKSFTAAKKLGGTVAAAVADGASTKHVRIAPSPTPGYSIICYYNENTGNFDRCVELPNSQVFGSLPVGARRR